MLTEHSNPVNLILEAYELNTTELTSTYRKDLRTYPPDIMVVLPNTKWSTLKEDQLGVKHVVKNQSQGRVKWEEQFKREMPELLQWQHYNRNIHELIHTNIPSRKMEVRKRLISNLKKFNIEQADESILRAIRLKVWNHLHKKEDAIWDPRGKRHFFEGLDIKNPKILVLGAGDGYDAMVLLSIYGGSAHMVDYDIFCKTDRFGKFPHDYPFIARKPQTDNWNIYTKDNFEITYEVDDFVNLKYGKEFDIILSSGLIEHYPDKLKPYIYHLHHQFLKPKGHIIVTASRNYAKLRTFYYLMNNALNYPYRELITAPQLGFWTHQNGFNIKKCGYIKSQNIVIATEQ